MLPVLLLGGSLASAQDLGAYRVQALAESPALKAAIQRGAAVRETGRREAALMPPMVELGLDLPRLELMLELEQAFPWPGTLRAAEERARAEAEVPSQAAVGLALVVRRQVDEAYWTLWSRRRAEALLDQQLTLLRVQSEVARAALAAGRLGLGEVQQLDLLALRVEDRLPGLRAEQRLAEAELRRLLGPEGSATATLPTPDEPPAPALPSLSPEQLLALAVEHPLRQQTRAEVQAALAAQRLARKERAPELIVGLMWPVWSLPVEEDSHPTEATTLRLGLRLWERGPGPSLRAAEHALQAARFEEEAARRELEAELAARLAEVQESARRLRAREERLLPQARATLEALLAAWPGGRADLSAVQMAWQQLLELEEESLGARAAHAIAWARLEELCGRPLERGALP